MTNGNSNQNDLYHISRYETADLQRCRRPFRRTIRRYNQLQHHVDGPSNQSTSPSNEETKAGIDYQYWVRCRDRICANESYLRSLESHSAQHYQSFLYNIIAAKHIWYFFAGFCRQILVRFGCRMSFGRDRGPVHTAGLRSNQIARIEWQIQFRRPNGRSVRAGFDQLHRSGN